MSERKTILEETVRIVVPLLIVGAGIAVFAVLMFFRNTPESKAITKTDPTVETVPIVAHATGFDIEVDGLVVPFREVSLSAEVAGRIISTSDRCRVGMYVASGTPLIEIDPKDYTLDLKRLNRELDQAKAALAEADVELSSTRQLVPLIEEEFELQKKQLARLEDLGRGVSTETAIDQARRNRLIAENAKIKLEQQVLMIAQKRLRLEHAQQLIEAQIEKAELDLTRTKISSPVGGVVVSEDVEQDTYVQKGTPLVTIEDTSAVEVKCSLLMQQLDWLWRQEAARGAATSSFPAAQVAGGDYQIPQAGVTVLYELGGRHFAWKGHLDRFDGIGAEAQTRTIPCRVVVDNPSDVYLAENGDPHQLVRTTSGPPALMRGMFVAVRIHCQPNTPLFRLPELAIRPGKQVWLVRDGKLAIEKVQLAAINNSQAILDGAVSKVIAGERAVISPLAYARPGTVVKQKPQQGAP